MRAGMHGGWPVAPCTHYKSRFPQEPRLMFTWQLPRPGDWRRNVFEFSVLRRNDSLILTVNTETPLTPTCSVCVCVLSCITHLKTKQQQQQHECQASELLFVCWSVFWAETWCRIECGEPQWETGWQDRWILTGTRPTYQHTDEWAQKNNLQQYHAAALAWKRANYYNKNTYKYISNRFYSGCIFCTCLYG